jgi:hypothetical protein
MITSTNDGVVSTTAEAYWIIGSVAAGIGNTQVRIYARSRQVRLH